MPAMVQLVEDAYHRGARRLRRGWFCIRDGDVDQRAEGEDLLLIGWHRCACAAGERCDCECKHHCEYTQQFTAVRMNEARAAAHSQRRLHHVSCATCVGVSCARERDRSKTRSSGYV